MKEIPIHVRSGRNAGDYVAIVDDCDYESLSRHRWNLCAQGSETNRRFYAVQRKSIRMHRLVWEMANGPIPAGAEIDHVEPGLLGGLDNRRSNLRLTNKSLNQANSRIGRNNTSGFKGVWWQKQARRWRADILVNRKKIHVGYFTDKREAALAYDAAALKHFGEHARLNFPLESVA